MFNAHLIIQSLIIQVHSLIFRFASGQENYYHYTNEMKQFVDNNIGMHVIYYHGLYDKYIKMYNLETFI